VSSIIEAAPKPNGIVGEAVKLTLDRFVWATPVVQAYFSGRILSQGRWKTDLSLGLLVAGTAGWGATEAGAQAKAALELGGWLANKDEANQIEVLEQMQQPFLLSILRILSIVENLDEAQFGQAEDDEDNSPFSSGLHDPDGQTLLASFLAQLDELVEAASRAATLSTKPLFDLYSRIRTDEAAHLALRCAGIAPASVTLVGFQEELERNLRATVDQPSRSDSYRDRSASVGSSLASSVAGTTRARRLETPLRYDAYAPPAEQGESDAQGEKERERRRWKRHEERERRVRGGKGGLGESVMELGQLRAAVGGEVEGSVSGSVLDSSVVFVAS